MVLEIMAFLVSVPIPFPMPQCQVFSAEVYKWPFIFGMQIKIEVLYKLILSFWVCVTRHTRSKQNKKSAYLCNISRKEWVRGGGGVKFIFYLQIKTEVFYKLIVSLWVCVARHARSTQNNKFTISLYYLNENVKDKFVLLPTHKHQRFLQIAIIILDLCGQACLNYPK